LADQPHSWGEVRARRETKAKAIALAIEEHNITHPQKAARLIAISERHSLRTTHAAIAFRISDTNITPKAAIQ
jgi:hypothetical protein